MLFGGAIFAQAPDRFPGHLIHIIVIFRFCFKIIVAAVIKADGSVPFYDVSAFFKQVGDVFVIMFLHDIHGPHDMHIIKPGLFVKVCQVPVCTEFGIRMEDTGTGKEPVYQVWVKCNLRVGCRSIKKGADLQVVVKLLEKEVANVKLPAGRDCGVVGLKFFGKVVFSFRETWLLFLASSLYLATCSLA